MTPIEPTDSELLTSYAVDGSEAAFGQLVRRHLGLVYSAALRQLGGGSASAEDVVQLVFTVLAREADGLRRRESIAGWLHTTTRHLSAKARRSDERRLLRETTALTMNPTDDTAAWEEMSPILDTALHELPDNDREAVLLRFFEKLSLSEVGSRLGVGEDAARKRVDRALDKLRGLLAKRGVTSATAAALAALLLDRASAAPPIQLAAEATATALKAAATVASGGLLAWFLGWPAKVALVAGLAAIVISVAMQRSRSGGHGEDVASAPTTNRVEQTVPLSPTAVASALAKAGSNPAAEEDTAGQLKLLLYLVDAATDKPVTGGKIEFRGWEGGKFIGKTYHSDTNGYALVYYPIGIADLEATTRIDGLADTRLKWTPKNGEIIPPDYTLRLAKAATVGGIVVDEDGQPISGATIGFELYERRVGFPAPESHEIGSFSATTGSDGHWELNRIAPELLQRLHAIHSRHPKFVPTESMAINWPELDQLKAHAYRCVLLAGIEVRGTVMDTRGFPVSGADIRVGPLDSLTSRSGKSAGDGTFTIPGCLMGKLPVTAMRDGFGAVTVEASVAHGMPPTMLILEAGKRLRVQVVDGNGKGIANANIWTAPDLGTPQVTLSRWTDSDGFATWEHAPMYGCKAIIHAEGYSGTETTIGAEEQEAVVQLKPVLKIRGDVRDASTGKLIPSFRIVVCRAVEEPETGPIIGDFNLLNGTDYVGGRFEQAFDSGDEVERLLVKVEAKGYIPGFSRFFSTDEGEARFDLRLKPEALNSITVLNPDGRPAVGAEVAMGRIGAGSARLAQPYLTPHGFDRTRNESDPVLIADGSGRVPRVWDGNGAIETLYAVSSEGYAETTPSVLEVNPTLRLHPFGAVEASLGDDREFTAATRLVVYAYVDRPGVRLTGFEAAFDATGHAVIRGVPPVRCSVGIRARGDQRSPIQLIESIEVRSNETASVKVDARKQIQP